MYQNYSKAVDDYYDTTIKITDDTGATREINYGCSVLKEEGRFLYELVRETAPEESLEIGLAWGASAIHILCALEDGGRGRHVAVDPLQDVWSHLGVREPARLGLGHRLTCLHERSDDVLPRFVAEGRSFQFAFIDGDHRFDAVFVDYYFTAKLLDVGGLLVFDDAQAAPIGMTLSFIDHNMRNFDPIPSPFRRFAAYRKTRQDDRSMADAIPFATSLPKPSHRVAGP